MTVRITPLRIVIGLLLLATAAFAQNAIVVSGVASYSAGESRQITQTTDGALRVSCD